MPDLNRKQLEEEFDMDHIENQPIPYEPSEDDPDQIIKANVDRANRILDHVEEELFNGNFSSRLVEVAAKCMDTITNAVSQLQSTAYNYDYLQLRDRMVKLKESELRYKITNKGASTRIDNQQNIIVTDRESILKALQQNNKKEIEYNE